MVAYGSFQTNFISRFYLVSLITDPPLPFPIVMLHIFMYLIKPPFVLEKPMHPRIDISILFNLRHTIVIYNLYMYCTLDSEFVRAYCSSNPFSKTRLK